MSRNAGGGGRVGGTPSVPGTLGIPSEQEIQEELRSLNDIIKMRERRFEILQFKKDYGTLTSNEENEFFSEWAVAVGLGMKGHEMSKCKN